MSVFVRIISKLALWILKRFGRGTDAPGRLALKLDKNILKKFKQPKIVIAVTGSSGKGSISYMIYKTLLNNNYKVAYNIEGSNLTSGITSLYLKNSNIFGKVNLDAIVLEVDESYANQVFHDVKPTFIVISNITRDQPPRNGNYRNVYNKIKSSITDNSILVINKDDPIVNTLTKDFNNKIISYGCCKTSDSFDKFESNCLDMVYCENCHKKFDYKYIQYGCIGNYKCNSCGFGRNEVDYEITSVEKNNLTINKKYKLNISNNITYLYYNIVAAFAVLSEIGINKNKILESLSYFEFHKKGINAFDYEGRKCEILCAKNENAVSYNQAINYVRTKHQKKTVVWGFRYISRRYAYQDLSWMYDIDFEFIDNIDTVICVGKWANDMALRFLIAGVKEENIKIVKSFDELDSYLTNTKGDIYAILDMGTENLFLESIKK